jgi:hypothetical protein
MTRSLISACRCADFAYEEFHSGRQGGARALTLGASRVQNVGRWAPNFRNLVGRPLVRNTLHDVVAGCEILVRGELCGVLAVGRCTTDGAAFCRAHSGVDESGNSVCDRCQPCSERERQAWDEWRAKAEAYGRGAGTAIVARLRDADVHSNLAHEFYHHKTFFKPQPWREVRYWATGHAATFTHAGLAPEERRLVLEESGHWGVIVGEHGSYPVLERRSLDTVQFIDIAGAVPQILARHGITS